MNLIKDPWLPVRARDGARHCIRPCDLVRPDIVDVDLPRADLAVAARTFLIGMLTTAGLVDAESDWHRLYDRPPTADALMATLQRFLSAFELFGDGRRFCQHASACAYKEPLRIASLLIDGPNESSDERNHDVMVDLVALSPAMTALALYTLQQFAVSGGSGHLQSMRRGSPMATLVSSGATLWHNIWINVETREQVAKRSPREWPDELADIFPWLGAPRFYADGLTTTTSDAHPLQVYWQMPSRLWLEDVSTERRRCGLTGAIGTGLATHYRKMGGGIKYAEDWRHPHVPHVRKADGMVPAQASTRASRVGDWLGVVYRDQNHGREPAAIVTTATTHRVWALAAIAPRVDVFGFEMSSNKVLGIVSHIMPIVAVEPIAADDLRATVEKAVLSVETVAEVLRKTAWAALVGAETTDAGKRTAGPDALSVKTAFLTAMEPRVEAAIRTAAAAIRASTLDPVAYARDLHRWLQREAAAAFDKHLPTDTWVRGIERRVKKRWELSLFLRGAGKAGAGLFAILQLPTPDAKMEANHAA